MSNSCEWPSRDDDERMTLVVAVGLLLGCTRGIVVQACTLDADNASSSSTSVDILLMLARTAMFRLGCRLREVRCFLSLWCGVMALFDRQ